MTRGEKNNNPLNIRYSPNNHWRGEITPPHLGGGRERVFCSFSSIEWGLRAGFCILRTYANKHKCYCIKDIISRWAPPNENDTQQYIRNVCQWTGYGGEENLTEHQWPRLIRAMAKMETGVWLSEELIKRAAPSNLPKGEAFRENYE